MKDAEREQLRKTILELLTKGNVHYRDIEKKTVATCLRFATSDTVQTQFYNYLLVNGYVQRTARGVYTITEKGREYLAILNR
jgi:Holliday junction resolvasome RuvABC ATP-dependent DNA helicase subunit